MNAPLLSIEGLSIGIGSGPPVVENMRLAVGLGESCALVGESGSGKSLTALSVLGLLPRGARIRQGSIRLEGRELTALSERQLRPLRGKKVGMVFQDPARSLNPHWKIGLQVLEAVRLHDIKRGRAARQRVLTLMHQVGLKELDRLVEAFPHELSGGQLQRVMIAMALAGRPPLLIADEPTTALDPSIQARILELFKQLKASLGMALLLISHDLRVVARLARQVTVMQGGHAVEWGPTARLLKTPAARHTRELLAAMPSIQDPPLKERGPAPPAQPPVLQIKNVSVRYPAAAGRPAHTAVAGVSLDIKARETLALVGASGSGKSSLVRAAMGLVPANSGQVLLRPHLRQEEPPRNLLELRGRAAREARRPLALVFQNPQSSLNPRWRVGHSLASTLDHQRPRMGRLQQQQRVAELLAEVELPPNLQERYPHQLSGGQAQRVAIARALAQNPRLLLLDEPVSALDATIQERVLKLLARLQQRHGLAMLLVSHDLGVVRRIAHRVAVMRAGQILECAPSDELFQNPQAAYTRELLSAQEA